MKLFKIVIFYNALLICHCKTLSNNSQNTDNEYLSVNGKSVIICISVYLSKFDRKNGIDFFYSFRSSEYTQSRADYKPFFDAGYEIFNIEFGANPLLYFPVLGIKKDIPYVFFEERFFIFLPDLLLLAEDI